MFRFFYEGFERLMSRCGCNCDIRYHDPFFSCRDGPLSGFTDSEGGDVDLGGSIKVTIAQPITAEKSRRRRSDDEDVGDNTCL